MKKYHLASKIILSNVKKKKKHIAVFAVVTILVISSVGTFLSVFVAENAPKLDIDLSSRRVEHLSPKNGDSFAWQKACLST